MRPPAQGFTLIELAIVLVIIGLIVGGVLVGQDLVRAAGVRATITQIEKYQTAVNTFYGKYGYLPGDIPAGPASQFGFQPRGQYAGEGDGNGVIEGVRANSANHNAGYFFAAGETLMFWVDLSTAGLIDGGFTGGTANVPMPTNSTDISDYFPAARIGRGNYIAVWSGGLTEADGTNYFELEAIILINQTGNAGVILGNKGLTVAEAHSIDSKIDDGLPQSGNVLAAYLQGAPSWTSQQGWPPYTTATPETSGTCYDNGNVGGATQQYSQGQNGGATVNCTLSFQFQ
jgi:prepilin-type N-terminal cleavage/methylation domain-containing protein